MARALTSPELASLRSKQATIPLLDVDVPSTVFACQVNQSFDTLDMVAELTYNNGSGDYEDVLPGMTVLVGTTAGADDLGKCRIRAAATADTLYIGMVSDIEFADDVHLTVIDEWLLWGKEPAVQSGGALDMDYDIEYSDQHDDMYPVVVAGPMRRVAKLEGASVDLAYDWTDSWVLGSSISSYSVSAPGSASITGAATSTPTITYDTAGRYWIAITATAANGQSTTVYRTVRIWSDASPLISDFTIDSCHGSYESGGWEFAITLYGDNADIRDMAMVTLVARDFYNDVQTSIGPVEGFENIIVIGWVDGETIDVDPHGGMTKFTVKGPQFWLNQLACTPVQLTNSAVTPTAWEEFNGLTVDMALYHLVTWRSTVAAIMDVFKSDDTRMAVELPGTGVVWWANLTEIAGKIFARPCCDRYGRLFVEIDPQLTETGSRSGPTVMTLAEGDWDENGMQIVRRNVSENAWVNLSTQWLKYAASKPVTLYHLSPGHTPIHWGANEMVMDNLLSDGQDGGNEMAGLYLGEHNRAYDFYVKLLMNNRAVDIVPAQYVAVDIAAEDTDRGVAYDGNIVIREVDFTQDGRGFMLASWYAEQESVPELSVDGDIPVGDGDFLDMPSIPPPPDLPPLPEIEPIGDDIGDEELAIGPNQVIIGTNNFGVLYTTNFSDDEPDWWFMNAGLDEDHADGMYRIFRLPDGGLVGAFDAGGEGLFLYYAKGLGAIWQPIPDPYITNPALDTTHRWRCMCIHPYKDEEIVAVTAKTAAFVAPINARFCVGDRNGLTIGAGDAQSLNWDKVNAFRGDVTYGYGRYLVTLAHNSIGTHPSVARVDEIGTEEYQQVFSGPPADPGRRVYSIRASESDIAYVWNSATPGTYQDAILRLEDEGETENWLDGFVCSTKNAYACDPTGQFLLGIKSASICQRSSDYGTTWGNVDASLGVGPDVVVNCNHYLAWIVSGGTNMKYTPDFGDTWVNKQGNLTEIAPLVDVIGMTFLEW